MFCGCDRIIIEIKNKPKGEGKMKKSEIGRMNVAEGQRFEIKIWNKVNHGKCLTRIRSSGSKGLFDVWSLDKSGKLRLIVAKTNGYLEPRERRELREFLGKKPDYVQVEIWYYKSKRKMTKKIVNNELDLWVSQKERR